jgi:hypothetical protein
VGKHCTQQSLVVLAAMATQRLAVGGCAVVWLAEKLFGLPIQNNYGVLANAVPHSCQLAALWQAGTPTVKERFASFQVGSTGQVGCKSVAYTTFCVRHC